MFAYVLNNIRDNKNLKKIKIKKNKTIKPKPNMRKRNKKHSQFHFTKFLANKLLIKTVKIKQLRKS